ncbi:glycoside hydrolase family 81 [Fusarium circinatum]|uniref:glucan endo-1,3-beta-D-glucosidase n=1 Tax=Fusarium circinatum TaxID=48490 RepID=A0A8H5TGY2_FUSCI|nr:glycoside hydrolase family 81 [Fusarium circinatum]
MKLVNHSSLGPIGTSNPNILVGGTVQTDAPPINSFFKDLKGPVSQPIRFRDQHSYTDSSKYPTNGWWAPYAAPPGTGTAAGPFPYESSLDGYGVSFGINQARDFDGTSVKVYTQLDWRASFTEHSGGFYGHKATAFDTQTVTVQYFQGNSSMTAYLVPGSPYITLEYKSATPLLTALNGGIKLLNGKTLGSGGTVSDQGTKFTVVDTKGTTYLIYSDSSIKLIANAENGSKGTLTADGKSTGILRLVMLRDPSHQPLLDTHSTVYPISVSQDYSISGDSGTVTFKWETKGPGDLLMLTWPHHREVLQSPNSPEPSALSYLTLKGWMYPTLGNTWRLTYKLTSITWNAPRDVDLSCKESVINGLKYEVDQLDPSQAPVPNEFYYWGGTLAAKSRLALIADHVGRNDLIDPVIKYLKASFEGWFSATNNALPAYETTWGGVINKEGATNVWVDFGNGYFNDHHFHYGYFLHIAAVIAKYDPDWLAQHREYVTFFARDIINPSSDDPFFPITRCLDWFAGHSWASGIANGAGSRDQESVGEAVNGYYGAMLWATVALGQEHANFARLLLAIEQQAARKYWHLYPSAGEDDPANPYPEAEFRDLITVGNVMDWQTGAWLFWGAEKVQIAAIQILPVTPVNEVMYDAEWVSNVFAYTMPELTNASYADSWKSVIYAAYANANPQEAAAWSANLSDWGSGNTYTNELYFISTRPNPNGQPICGNFPENPYGDYKIQTTSGKYIVSAANGGQLSAASNSTSYADVFSSAYVPNAGTLQLAKDKQYVTADQSGTYSLSAARTIADTWERFIIRQKVGEAEGVYSIKAFSNGKYVRVGGDGTLVNDGAVEDDGTGFRFIKA